MTLFLVAIGLLALNAFVSYSKSGSIFPFIVLSSHSKVYLKKNFSFYQKLPSKSKAIFESRVARFISTKRFIARSIPEVTMEMKVLIAASAVQLTFGFPKINLSFFTNILIYPDAYYSTINRQYHKGEVNPRLKAIVLSWRYFVEGYLQPNGRNLGLHEMAHALQLENSIRNREYNFLDSETLVQWHQIAQNTMSEILEGRETFFREYGAYNSHEFFAVSVENFFERPREFNEQHPKTYRTLCKLLNQDPLMLEKI